MTTLRLIGYWNGSSSGKWPDPRATIDERWDAEEREGVGIHLRHGVVARSFLGSSKCRLCEQYVGNLELTDGVYVWPEGLAHYVVEHLVRLPAEFVEHVDQHAGAVDEWNIDSDWWTAFAGRSERG
jgi:hypothetical protein